MTRAEPRFWKSAAVLTFLVACAPRARSGGLLVCHTNTKADGLWLALGGRRSTENCGCGLEFELRRFWTMPRRDRPEMAAAAVGPSDLPIKYIIRNADEACGWAEGVAWGAWCVGCLSVEGAGRRRLARGRLPHYPSLADGGMGSFTHSTTVSTPDPKESGRVGQVTRLVGCL